MASNNNFATNDIIDFKFMSKGGLLLDSSGDISFTDSNLEAIQNMIATRVQSSLDGWKLYNIGAGLDKLIGSANSNELEIAVQKQVTQALTNQFLALGSFTVDTIRVGNTISIYIYIQNNLVSSTSLALN